MSTVAVSSSIRSLSLLPVARGPSAISEIPPPIALASPPVARRVSFASLPPIVQERFESAIRGTFPPSPLLRAVRPRTGSRAAWIAIALVASLAGIGLAARGYGSLGGIGPVQSPTFALVYGALAVTAIYALLRALGVAASVRAMPWPAGVYVFPTALVDARTTTLDVLPLLDLARVETDARARRVRLVFTNGRAFAFAADDGDDVASIGATIEDARARAKDLAVNADASACALVDPLFESPEAPPLEDEPRRTNLPAWLRRAGWVAAIGGILAGPALHRARDAASDAEAFRRALARDDVATWRAYLAAGGAHRVEVESDLLPRAEARDRHTALLRELERATSEGTLAALDAFVAAHPDHDLDAELRTARHAVFVRALERYRTVAPDAEAVAFVARLLAVAEARGPEVRVVFRREPSPTLKDADAAVEGSNKFAGMVSHPSPWLDVASDGLEAAFVAAVHARFADVFPTEILDVVAGPAGATDAADAPAIVIAHRVDWSGEIVAVQGFPGILVGARFVFDATFALPDGGAPLGLSTTIDGQPNASPMERLAGGPAPEEGIYSAMTARAFDAWRDDVLASLF